MRIIFATRHYFEPGILSAKYGIVLPCKNLTLTDKNIPVLLEGQSE